MVGRPARRTGRTTPFGSPRRVPRPGPPALFSVLFAVLLAALAGCGSPAPAPAAAPVSTPPVSTPAGYQDLLDQTNRDLAAALTAIDQARSMTALEQAVLRGAGVASAAGERLTTSGPVPPSVADDNATLAAGLRQFGRELAYLSQQINLHAICAGPTAFDAITTAPSTPALRSAAAALASPRADRPVYRWGSALPPPTDAPRTTVANGALLVDRRAGATGDGVLRASNDGGTDAVVVLARSGAAVVSMAVDAGQSARLDGVPDGDYDLYYTVGKDWDAQLSTFSRHCEFHRFTAPSTFHTTAVQGGTGYTLQSVALHTPPDPGEGPVPLGPEPAATPPDAPGTATVPPDAFPR